MAPIPYFNEHFFSHRQPVILSVNLNLHSKNESVTTQTYHEGNTWKNKAFSELRALINTNSQDGWYQCGYFDSDGKLLTLPFPSFLNTNHSYLLLNIFYIMQIVPTLCHAFACDAIPILITF